MVTIQNISLDLLLHNEGQIEGLPKNPRKRNAKKYSALKDSIRQDPEGLDIRELVCVPFGEKFVVVDGNMRLDALRDLKYETAPCKVIPADTPTDKMVRYIAKFNLSFGDWDFSGASEEDLETFHEEFDDLDFDNDFFKTEAKVKIVSDEADEDEDSEEYEDLEERKEFLDKLLDDRLYPSDNEFDIPCLMLEQQPKTGVVLPFAGWGQDSRLKKGIGTYHFYVEDYRFEAIWKDPNRPLIAGTRAFVEPNFSLFDTTPLAFGLQQIYKKRWIARYWQESGAEVWADLNVARKFQKWNMLGIPKGYNAFFTRGYADRTIGLYEEIEIAKQISGKEHPNLIVYGGGTEVQQICRENQLVYLEQFAARMHKTAKDE